MPIKLGRRRKGAAKAELKESNSIDEEFKSKLNLLLRSPQGNEIQRRNWRVSDKFMGGKRIEDYREERDYRKSRSSREDAFDQFVDFKKKSKREIKLRKQRRHGAH